MDDAQAAYEGDPAAVSADEAIFCYPGLRAITDYRIAHELHELEVPLLPRMITETCAQPHGASTSIQARALATTSSSTMAQAW